MKTDNDLDGRLDGYHARLRGLGLDGVNRNRRIELPDDPKLRTWRVLLAGFAVGVAVTVLYFMAVGAF